MDMEVHKTHFALDLRLDWRVVFAVAAAAKEALEHCVSFVRSVLLRIAHVARQREDACENSSRPERAQRRENEVARTHCQEPSRRLGEERHADLDVWECICESVRPTPDRERERAQ